MDNQKTVKSSLSKRKRQQVFFAWSFILIPVLYMFATWIFVNGQTVVFAFRDDYGEWGFMNFVKVWERFTDPFEVDLAPMVVNTLQFFFVQEFIGVPVSLIVSYFIYKKVAGYKAFRVIFYLPSILPVMVLVIAFSQFVFPGGVFDVLCKGVGITLPEEGLLYNEDTAKGSLMFYMFLTSACGNILFYSSMARIPQELIEAAQIDGITAGKEFIYIVLPLIMPTFSYTLLMDFTGVLMCTPPILEFNVPPGTTTVSYWFFAQVYEGGVSKIGQYGFMSALGLCFTAVSLPIVFFVRWLAEKFASVEY